MTSCPCTRDVVFTSLMLLSKTTNKARPEYVSKDIKQQLKEKKERQNTKKNKNEKEKDMMIPARLELATFRDQRGETAC